MSSDADATRVFKTRAQPFDLIGYKKLKPKIV